MAHVHLRRVMAQNIRLDLLDPPRRFWSSDIDLMQRRFGVEIRLLPSREIIEDMHFMTAFQISIDNVRADETRATVNQDSNAFCSSSRARHYSMLSSSPPS